MKTDPGAFALTLPKEFAPVPGYGFLSMVGFMVPVTADPPPVDGELPWDPAADSPWGILQTIELDDPKAEPAGPPWNRFDRCATCSAPPRQPCRDRRTRDKRPATAPHRGRPAYVSPAYLMYLIHKYGGYGNAE